MRTLQTILRLAMLAICFAGTGSLRADPPAVSADADEQTSGDVRRTLQAAKFLSVSARNISLSTRDGIVRLKGRVASERERGDVADIVRGVGSVIGINDDLLIDAPGPSGRKYLYK
ncbi:MAG TPA: BON domain-containing protein [Planctomycetota bacterium]|nr:BON domain-containing protein [Planctomycetota bacterium]